MYVKTYHTYIPKVHCSLPVTANTSGTKRNFGNTRSLEVHRVIPFSILDMRGPKILPLIILTSQVDFQLYSAEAFVIGTSHDFKKTVSMAVKKEKSPSKSLKPMAADGKSKVKRRNRLISFVIERFTRGYDTTIVQHTAQPLSDSSLYMHTNVIDDTNQDRRSVFSTTPRTFYKSHASGNVIPIVHNNIPEEAFPQNCSIEEPLKIIHFVQNGTIQNTELKSLPIQTVTSQENPSDHIIRSRNGRKQVKKGSRSSSHEKALWTLLDWLLHHLIASRSTQPTENLLVSVRPTKNKISGMVFQGEFEGDIQIQFNKIYLQTLRITGGGTLRAKAVRINIYSWIPTHVVSTVQQVFRIGGNQVSNRFPSSFKLQAYRVALTNEDLLQSSCVRMGLRSLFRRILKSLSYLAPQDVIIQAVNILVSLCSIPPVLEP
jgi:hypothetical protein